MNHLILANFLNNKNIYYILYIIYSYVV